MIKNNSTKYIYNKIKKRPEVCVLLGSGLGTISKQIKNKIIIKYSDVPNFHDTSISGHKGEFIFGYINGIPILCAMGRFHYYEGFSFEEIGSIIEIFHSLHPKLTIITNSSGCLNMKWDIGSFMLVNEFLDFSFINSKNTKRFKLKNNKYYTDCLKIAEKNNIKLYEGTYTFTSGPSYETKSEIKEIISLDGHAVGMSTFPEYIKCKSLKMTSLFISCLTNYGAGLTNNKIEHIDVIANAVKAKDKFCTLIIKIIENIGSRKKQKKL